MCVLLFCHLRIPLSVSQIQSMTVIKCSSMLPLGHSCGCNLKKQGHPKNYSSISRETIIGASVHQVYWCLYICTDDWSYFQWYIQAQIESWYKWGQSPSLKKILSLGYSYRISFERISQVVQEVNISWFNFFSSGLTKFACVSTSNPAKNFKGSWV